MKQKLLIVGGIALLAAVLTTAFFYQMLSDRIGDAASDEMQLVVVATEDLPRGTQLKEQYLTVEAVPVARQVACNPVGNPKLLAQPQRHGGKRGEEIEQQRKACVF